MVFFFWFGFVYSCVTLTESDAEIRGKRIGKELQLVLVKARREAMMVWLLSSAVKGMRKLCKRRLQRKQQKRLPGVAMLELRIPRNRKLGVVTSIAVSNLSFPFVCHVIHCLNVVMQYNLIRLDCQSIRFWIISSSFWYDKLHLQITRVSVVAILMSIVLIESCNAPCA